MKKFLVSKCTKERQMFIKNNSLGCHAIGIYNQLPIDDLKSYFSESYSLQELYNDEVFLLLLAKIGKGTKLFFIDLGIDYCSFKADYIKPFTKLNPLFQQAGETFIIDYFAFYNTEKSIYRPFLYIDDLVLDSTVQQFYNSKGYEDFIDNTVEKYYQKIKPYIEINVKPLVIETISYEPTDIEKHQYQLLKEDIILNKKYPKQKVIRLLTEFIENSTSKKEIIKPILDNSVLNVYAISSKMRIEMYKKLRNPNIKKVVFYTSNYYGVEKIELELTLDAIQKHNELIRLINGKESL